MTSRERLTTVLQGKIPDCVPVSPDTSNMIPAKMTGLPFWDIYLYKKKPSWMAYLDCVKYFGFDSLMDGYLPLDFEELGEINNDLCEYIIFKNDEKIITQICKVANGKMFWQDRAAIYFIDNPPVRGTTAYLGLSPEPSHYEKVEGVCQWKTGEELLKFAKSEMGDHGLVGITCGTTSLIKNEEELYSYFDNPEPFYQRRKEFTEACEKRFNYMMSLETKPDFICTGSSGSLIWQTPQIFRELSFPIAKRITDLCHQHGIFSHVHSCGPEKELVQIMAEETNLTVIDPLEIPPAGNCNLKELKKAYGDKIVLKGNLHTTDVMLYGSVEDVKEAAKRAIDDAAEGGRFILSTGDQCGRDTPYENIFALVEIARTYGKY